jgi:hypothetical protein
MSNTSKNEKSLQILQECVQQLHKTEEIALDTHSKLKQQTEQIQNANKKVDTTNQNLSFSNKLLGRMNKWWR